MDASERFFEQQNVSGICPNAYMDFVARSTEVRTKEQFVSLVSHALQPIFPHGMMLAELGQALPNGISVRHAIGINYPNHYLAKLHKTPIFAGPILSKWLETLEPQLFEVQRPAATIPKRWLNAVRRASIQNIAAHGVCDASGSGASYFTFSEIPAPNAAILGVPLLRARDAGTFSSMPEYEKARAIQIRPARFPGCNACSAPVANLV